MHRRASQKSRKTSPSGRRGGATGAATPARAKSPSREGRSAARRDAILAAALEEFSTSGFAAARLDDVARRAGIAKGTIYLYFSDKETLFQELIRATLMPLVGIVKSAPMAELSFSVLAEKIIDLFVTEIYGTRRRDVIRLIMSEGPRFPKIAEFHYRNVVGPILIALRALLARAVERGEVPYAAVARFPELLVAPGIVAIFWSAMFERFSPLDVKGLMQAHLEILLGKGNVR